MHKSKKKSAKIPKPIKVKKEKTEEDRTPQSMSHYVDDRLELVKQIFGSLKPKTITNLAPDFLKKKELEEIQELCLNELLGISKKRLLSVINATKCPSDTDSSDDSDVHNIEEHVSLEEISSDSDFESGAGKASKKKSSGVAAKGGSKKTSSKNAAEKNENTGGQISVLELLELQARARAIRSQLALEPVTKIEVDDDDDDDDDAAEADEISSTKSKESQNNNNLKERKRKSNDQAVTTKNLKTNGTVAPKEVHTNDAHEKQQLSVGPSKKIKLKRNFRMNADTGAPAITQNEKKSEEQQKSKPVISNNDIKEEKCSPSRSASPDVIPIITETETLMISDSSDEEQVESVPTKHTKKPTVLITSVEVLNTALETNSLQAKISAPAAGSVASSNTSSNTNKEAEDGEISNETVLASEKTVESAPELSQISASDVIIEQKENQPQSSTSNLMEEVAKQIQIDNQKSSENIATEEPLKINEPTPTTEMLEKNTTAKTSKPNKEKQATQLNTDKTLEPNKEQQATQLNTVKTAEPSAVPAVLDEDDDDQNDDVISIEGGDLETEMTEHLVNDNKRHSFSAVSPKKEEKAGIANEPSDTADKTSNKTQADGDDVISLGSSEDELTKESRESWNTRWLKSSKVTKVLATSKLGKRVRDKIKKTKRNKKDSLREDKEAEAKKNSSTSSYTSKHELGSIEQYKELLEIQRQQRKD